MASVLFFPLLLFQIELTLFLCLTLLPADLFSFHSPPKMQKAAAQVGDGLSYRVFCFASDCSAYLSSRG